MIISLIKEILFLSLFEISLVAICDIDLDRISFDLNWRACSDLSHLHSIELSSVDLKHVVGIDKVVVHFVDR